MKNKWFCYIQINEEENYVNTSGMTFNEFYEGIQVKPNNILILKGYPGDRYCQFDNKTDLEYVTSDNIKDFAQTNVYDYGDFYWLDFKSIDSLKSISDLELAEILFLAHKAKPVKTFRFGCLNNQYVYCCHDDSWSVKVYMNRIESYKSVIEYKILKELKGKKKTISPFPKDISDRLYTLFKQGGIIDFEYGVKDSVRIYPVGCLNDMDAIHEKLDKLRTCLKGLSLGYNRVTKKWDLYEW